MFFLLLPYRVGRRIEQWPWATSAIIAVNLVCFGVQQYDPEAIIRTLGFTPAWSGLYTWFTSMFVHASPAHLLLNLYFLWLFGAALEDAIGPARFATLYLLGGACALALHTVVTFAVAPEHLYFPVIGASGAIASIMGCFAVRRYRTPIKVWWFFLLLFFPRAGTFEVPAYVGLGFWFAGQLLAGLLTAGSGAFSGVADWAHVGGFLAGVVVAWLSGYRRLEDLEVLAEEADRYESGGMPGVAASKYARLADVDPDDPTWRQRAVAAAMQAEAADPVRAGERLGSMLEALIADGERGEALDTYRRWATGPLAPPLPERALMGIAALADGADAHDVAGHAYAQVVERMPETRSAEKAAFRLAHVYLASGDREQAMEVWRAFSSAYPRSTWMPMADSAFFLAE